MEQEPSPAVAEQAKIAVGNLVINLDANVVGVAENRIHLTRRQYQILEFLALKKGQVVTKDMILTHLYGGADEPEHKIIDVFVCKIRKSLAGAGCTARVETVWGRGYKLVDSAEGET